MTEYAPIYMVVGLLAWGAIFVIVSDLGDYIKRRRQIREALAPKCMQIEIERTDLGEWIKKRQR